MTHPNRNNQDFDLLRARLPEEVYQTFNQTQLDALSKAFGAPGKHTLDWRPVVKIPLLPWSFYLVFLLGKNRRALSASEQRVAARALIGIFVGAITLLCAVGLIVLYLLKSALGIDLIEGYHLGLWFWFEDHFLKD